ncbi:hypothetical protein HanRHA438_Chr02g0059901 [Helianthus annuus]|nr:hypothetical protein HanRHA438_Chr02g0059901 [Helianthus annuus]
MNTSVDFKGAERLNLTLESLMSFSISCKRATESKYSSEVMVKQLELAELEERDPGSIRSFNSI